MNEAHAVQHQIKNIWCSYNKWAHILESSASLKQAGVLVPHCSAVSFVGLADDTGPTHDYSHGQATNMSKIHVPQNVESEETTKKYG